MYKRGLSVIEILIIFLVLILLAAIIVPVLSSSREIIPQSPCMNSQKQIAVAISIYVQDHRETMPEDRYFWAVINIPRKVLHCQQDDEAVQNSYVFNHNLSAKMLKDLNDPAATILTADGRHVKSAGRYDNIMYSDDDLLYRHNGGLMASFIDGHVEYLHRANDWTEVPVKLFPPTAAVRVTGQAHSELKPSIKYTQICRVRYQVPYRWFHPTEVALHITPAPTMYRRAHVMNLHMIGDGSGNRCRIRLVDAQGEVFEYTRASFEPTDCLLSDKEQTLTVNLDRIPAHTWSERPGTKLNDQLDYPVRFDRLIIQRSAWNSSSSGEIVLLGMTVATEGNRAHMRARGRTAQ